MWIRAFKVSFILLFAMHSCINNHKPTAIAEHVSASNIIGSYTGSLPCVDCEAISTVLHLDRDNSYRLIYTYEGKSNDKFVKQGSWLIDDNHLVLKGVDYQYRIEPEFLLQLDLSGKEIKGDIAEKYQLSKVK